MSDLQGRDYSRAVEYFGGGKNPWLWRESKTLDKPKDFMLKAIQDYVLQLFDAGDEQVKHM
jgi:hypothetical protein